MTELTKVYSIEVDDRSTQRITVFTFMDLTAGELRTVLAEFRHLLAGMGGNAVISFLAAAGV